eukprot:COSAG06_NODE_53998_length_297_cov_0.459596_1_plen_35_part_10
MRLLLAFVLSGTHLLFLSRACLGKQNGRFHFEFKN